VPERLSGSAGELDVEGIGAREGGRVRKGLAWMELESRHRGLRRADLALAESSRRALDDEGLCHACRDGGRIDLQDAVEVVREAHVDRLLTGRSAGQPRYLELAELLVLGAEGVLALKYLHADHAPGSPG
jgi:hypothetical protein